MIDPDKLDSLISQLYNLEESPYCIHCTETLTLEEWHYYHNSCEECIREMQERIKDKEFLDKHFGT